MTTFEQRSLFNKNHPACWLIYFRLPLYKNHFILNPRLLPCCSVWMIVDCETCAWWHLLWLVIHSGRSGGASGVSTTPFQIFGILWKFLKIVPDPFLVAEVWVFQVYKHSMWFFFFFCSSTSSELKFCKTRNLLLKILDLPLIHM